MHPSNLDSKWKHCRRCRLYTSRRHVVLSRIGYCRNGMYCDTDSPPSSYPNILFIGDAPGEQDDHSAIPFNGSNGRILNMYFHYTHSNFRYHITNLIGCRPTTEDYRGDLINRDPLPPEIDACHPRLAEIVSTIEFAGVVYLGKLSTAFRPKQFLGPKNLFQRSLELLHPNAILRQEYKLHSIKTQALLLENYVKSTTPSGRENLHRG